MKEQLFIELLDFSGGLNQKTSKFNLRTDRVECQSCKNVWSDDTGDLLRRHGIENKISGTPTSEPLNWIDKFYHDTHPARFCVGEDTKLKYLKDDNTLADILTGLTSGQRPCSLVLNNFLWVVNGKDTPIVCTLSATAAAGYDWMFAKPASAPGATEGYESGGKLNVGVYRWKVTYYVSTGDFAGWESSPCAYAEEEITAGSPDNNICTLDLSAIDNPTDARIDKMRIYRTVVNGNDYLLEETVADNTASYVSGNAATGKSDSQLNSAVICPSSGDHDVPPDGLAYTTEYGKMVVAAGDPNYPRRYYWSKVGYPQYFPSSNYEDVPNPIIGVFAHRGFFLVFDTTGLTLVQIIDEVPRETRIELKAGLLSHFAVAKDYADRIYFPTRYGITVIDTSFGIDQKAGWKIEPLLRSISANDYPKLTGCFWKGYYILAYPDGTNYNNRWLVTDVRHLDEENEGLKHWIFDLNAADFKVLDGTGDAGELYFANSEETGGGAGDEDGKIFEFKPTATDDDGTAIDYEWLSGVLTGEAPELNKAYQKTFIDSLLYDELTIDFNVDEGRQVDTLTISPVAGATKWGAFKWGGSQWYGRDMNEDKYSFSRGVVGKRVTVNINGSDTQTPWHIYNLRLLAYLKTLMRS